jgi:hypothetical protein
MLPIGMTGTHIRFENWELKDMVVLVALALMKEDDNLVGNSDFTFFSNGLFGGLR